jgi:hypothetical protein
MQFDIGLILMQRHYQELAHRMEGCVSIPIIQ